MKQYHRKPVWNLAGTLNELDTPSETKDSDVIECVNWKPSKDKRSREKRPGYSSVDNITDPPIIQCHSFVDHNNFDRIIVVTQHKVKMRKDVAGFTQMYEDNTATYSNFFSICEYDGKLTVMDTPDGVTAQLLQSSDGTTWNVLSGSDTTIPNLSYSMLDIIEYNGSLWAGFYNGSGTTVKEWDGLAWDDSDPIGTNYHACSFQIWDGKLWLISFVTPSVNDRWKIHYYSGSSWSNITDFDGAAYVDAGANPSAFYLNHRFARLIVYNNELYLICTVYDSGTTSLTWQVWKFNAATYSEFNKIYDSKDDSHAYALGAIRYYDGLFYLIGIDDASLNSSWIAAGNSVTTFTSPDLMTWTKKTQQTMGIPYSDYIFDGRLYVEVLVWDAGTNDYTDIWYWDKAKELWVKEGSITTHTNNTVCGKMISYLGDMYITKYREIRKRAITSNEWTDVYYTEEEIELPPTKVAFDDRLIIGFPSGNVMIEGTESRQLGITPPDTAPTAAAGAAGALTGDYEYMVTFYRSGNYPCESNPSPESTAVTLSSEKCDLSAIPTSADPKVNARRLYRTKANGAIFYWLVDIEDNTTTTYEDNYTDDELGDEVSYDRLPPPSGKYFEVWDSRLWIAGNTEFPNLLFFTNLGTAEEWGSSNFLNVKRRESDTIQQIKAYGDKLYVFKRNSVHVVEKAGDSLYEVTQLPQNIGTDAPWSVAVCDNLLIWKSEYGIEVFNGVRCYRPIPSEAIRRTIASINQEHLDYCIGGHNMTDGEYWLTVPTGSDSTRDKTIVFNYLDNTFTTYVFAKTINSIYGHKDYIEGLRMLLGTSDGYLYAWADGWTDAGTNISANFRTKWFYVGDQNAMWNILRRMYIKYILPASKTITMKIYKDFDKTAIATISLTGVTPTDDVNLRNEIFKRINLRVTGNYFCFEFINNEDTGGECRIRGFDLFFRNKLPKQTVSGD